jgi:hypothetical protein
MISITRTLARLGRVLDALLDGCHENALLVRRPGERPPPPLPPRSGPRRGPRGQGWDLAA